MEEEFEILPAEELINPLEYQPSFQRDERIKTGWQTSRQENPGREEIGYEEEKDIGTGIVTEVVEEFESIQSHIQEQIALLEKKYEKHTFLIEEAFLSDTLRAKEELGLDGKEITFKDYSEALKKIDTPAGDFLVEIIERQIEDLEGNMELELYQDYVELSLEYEMLERFLKNAIKKNLSYVLNLEEDEWRKDFLEQEKEWGKEVREAKEAYEQSTFAYRRALLFDPSLIPQKRNQQYVKEGSLFQKEDEESQVTDVTTLIRIKNKEVGVLLHWMKENQEREPYSEDLALPLSQSMDTNDEWKESLSNLSFLLKVSVDSHNEDKYQVKQTLRNVYSVNKQEKIMNELELYQKAFHETVLPQLHKTKVYNEELNESLTLLMNEATKGMKKTQNERNQLMLDFFRTNRAATSLRKNKFNETIQKDNARQGYHLLKTIEEETKESGKPSG